MDSVRSFAAGNRSTIINVVYVVAFLVAIYYLYKWFKEGSALDLDLLPTKVVSAMPTAASELIITDSQRPSVRINTGGEYTFSMWMYINSWDGSSPGKPKNVFYIRDDAMTNNFLMVGALYPNTPKMLIRAHTRTPPDVGTDVTNVSKYQSLFNAGSQEFSSMLTSISLPQCDVQDVDLQRWIHLCVSINGRIMDVYMDGKLARSCILPDIPLASENGNQAIGVGGFPGYVSGVKFRAYALTPDRIYAEYQSGPYATSNFVTYIAEKFGIKLNYIGAYGQQKSANL